MLMFLLVFSALLCSIKKQAPRTSHGLGMPVDNADFFVTAPSTWPAADSEFAQPPDKFDERIEVDEKTECEWTAKHIEVSNDPQPATMNSKA